MTLKDLREALNGSVNDELEALMEVAKDHKGLAGRLADSKNFESRFGPKKKIEAQLRNLVQKNADKVKVLGQNKEFLRLSEKEGWGSWIWNKVKETGSFAWRNKFKILIGVVLALAASGFAAAMGVSWIERLYQTVGLGKVTQFFKASDLVSGLASGAHPGGANTNIFNIPPNMF
jgi:hypothetical protein